MEYKMKNLILVFGLIFWIEGIICENLLTKFRQHDYKVNHLRSELVNYNKDYINYASIKSFKYNRTAPAANFTANLKINMNNKIEVVVQAYKFASNEYRLFPMRFQVNVCKSYNANIAGIQAQLGKCGNVTSCYITANVTYHVCNFMVDPSRLPPYFPNGDFMMEFQVLHGDMPIMVMRSYAEVYRPIPYPK